MSELLTCDIEKILLDETSQLSLYERIEFAAQAAEGMAWLHGAGVIHWFVSPSSFLYVDIIVIPNHHHHHHHQMFLCLINESFPSHL